VAPPPTVVEYSVWVKSSVWQTDTSGQSQTDAGTVAKIAERASQFRVSHKSGFLPTKFIQVLNLNQMHRVTVENGDSPIDAGTIVPTWVVNLTGGWVSTMLLGR